jgi:hypothetical protein
MVVLPVLSIATYGAAVVGHHPNIDGPDALEKFSGFLRIAAVILLLLGFVSGIASVSGQTLGMSVVALIVVGLLATYDYMIVAKKARDSAKESVAKAGKEYLETKKEINKGPDQVTNVQGDAVSQKTQQTHVDQSTTNVDRTTNVDQIDQSRTHVDQSRTVNDQRTQVEDSVVNRSDISAADETTAPQGGQQQPPQQPPQQPQQSQPQNQPPQQQPQNQQSRRQPNQQRPPQEREVEANPRNRGGQPAGQGGQSDKPTGQQNGPSQPAGQTGGGGNGGDAEYCPECGEEITPGWSNCISCGAKL